MADPSSIKLYKYLWVHEPSEQVITVLGSSKAKSRLNIPDKLIELGLDPKMEGHWASLGMGGPWPTNEEW